MLGFLSYATVLFAKSFLGYRIEFKTFLTQHIILTILNKYVLHYIIRKIVIARDQEKPVPVLRKILNMRKIHSLTTTIKF